MVLFMLTCRQVFGYGPLRLKIGRGSILECREGANCLLSMMKDVTVVFFLESLGLFPYD